MLGATRAAGPVSPLDSAPHITWPVSLRVICPLGRFASGLQEDPGTVTGGAACLRPAARFCLVGRGRLPRPAGTPASLGPGESLRRGWTHLRDSVSGWEGAEVLSHACLARGMLSAGACQACPALQLAPHLAGWGDHTLPSRLPGDASTVRQSLRQGRLFRLFTSCTGSPDLAESSNMENPPVQ